MDQHQLQLEQLKIYRDWARYYFDVRSRLTYINILGCGSVTVFFAQKLIDNPADTYLEVVKTHFLLYFVGSFAIVALAVWSTALCNLLSNSYFSYLTMARGLEDELGTVYPTPKSWAVTFEFLTKEAQEDTASGVFRGNVWNTANAFMVLYGLYMLMVVSRIAEQEVIFFGAASFNAASLALALHLGVRSKLKAALSWLALCTLFAMPFLASTGHSAPEMRSAKSLELHCRKVSSPATRLNCPPKNQLPMNGKDATSHSNR